MGHGGRHPPGGTSYPVAVPVVFFFGELDSSLVLFASPPKSTFGDSLSGCCGSVGLAILALLMLFPLVLALSSLTWVAGCLLGTWHCRLGLTSQLWLSIVLFRLDVVVLLLSSDRLVCLFGPQLARTGWLAVMPRSESSVFEVRPFLPFGTDGFSAYVPLGKGCHPSGRLVGWAAPDRSVCSSSPAVREVWDVHSRELAGVPGAGVPRAQ